MECEQLQVFKKIGNYSVEFFVYTPYTLKFGFIRTEFLNLLFKNPVNDGRK
jgi:hypothetical protein